jgi:cyanate permease
VKSPVILQFAELLIYLTIILRKTQHFKAIVAGSLILCKLQPVPHVFVPSFLKMDANQTASVILDLHVR